MTSRNTTKDFRKKQSYSAHSNTRGGRSREKKSQAKALCVLLLVAVLFLVPLSVGFAAPASDEDVDRWFSQYGSAVLSAQGSEAFPDISANELHDYSVGTPLPLATISSKKETNPNNIAPQGWWMAPISNGSELLGVLLVDFRSGKAQREQVSSDEMLADTLYQLTTGVIEPDALFYDTELNAWFTVNNDAVSPADFAGAAVVAGSVPVADFLLQRSRNFGVETSESTVNNTQEIGNAPLPNDRISAVTVVMIVLVIVGLLTVSLLWLRWEARHADKQAYDDRPAPAPKSGSFAVVAVEGDTERIDASQPGNRSKASGMVRVYRRHKHHAASESHNDHPESSPQPGYDEPTETSKGREDYEQLL